MYDPNPAFVRRVEVRVQELLSRYDWWKLLNYVDLV
jgi:hypothetical protein